MSISRKTLGLLVAVGITAAAPAAHASPPQTATADQPASWTTTAASGLNTSYLAGESRGTCAGTNPTNICDTTLVRVTATDIEAGQAAFRIEGFLPTSDFDIRVYEAEADGTKGTKVGTLAGDVDSKSPLGSNDPRHTGPGDFETTTVTLDSYIDPETNDLDQHFLVVVPYFAVVNDKYTGKAAITVTKLPAPEPETVPGLSAF